VANKPTPLISVVVPCYNEEAMVEAFWRRTAPVLEALDPGYEIVFVNDGSRDRTAARIFALHLSDPRVKLVDLSRNFGKEIAMSAGLDYALGQAVVIMDADLQDPPELIPELVALWRQGFDTVYATRSGREGEGLLKRITAALFYRVIGKLSRTTIPADTGDFRLMSRRVVDAVKQLRERHRFMKGLFSWVGFPSTGITYRREPRFAGKTKWNYWRLWNFAIEGISSFSMVPLQLSGYIGFAASLFAFLYALVITGKVLIYGRDMPGYASIMVAILFFSGLQLIILGVIGEYVGRMFNEVKKRPLYLVQDVVGISDPADEI
jgi:glycosyltransferase involved in cell wall biosynthesis